MSNNIRSVHIYFASDFILVRRGKDVGIVDGWAERRCKRIVIICLQPSTTPVHYPSSLSRLGERWRYKSFIM